jgi:AhpD family alkylhydroperoxidase
MSHDDNGSSTTSGTADHAVSHPDRSAHRDLYPEATRALADQRSRLAPGPAEAFRAFSRSVFAPAALPTKTKQLIAVAVAHVTQCPYCIRSHTRAALGRTRCSAMMRATLGNAERAASGTWRQRSVPGWPLQ